MAIGFERNFIKAPCAKEILFLKNIVKPNKKNDKTYPRNGDIYLVSTTKENLIDGFSIAMIVIVERGWRSPRTQIVKVDVDGLDVDVFCSLSTMWDNLWFFPRL